MTMCPSCRQAYAEECAQVYAMIVERKMKYREVAAHFGKSIGWVQTRVNAAQERRVA